MTNWQAVYNKARNALETDNLVIPYLGHINLDDQTRNRLKNMLDLGEKNQDIEGSIDVHVVPEMGDKIESTPLYIVESYLVASFLP